MVNKSKKEAIESAKGQEVRYYNGFWHYYFSKLLKIVGFMFGIYIVSVVINRNMNYFADAVNFMCASIIIPIIGWFIKGRYLLKKN